MKLFGINRLYHINRTLENISSDIGHLIFNNELSKEISEEDRTMIKLQLHAMQDHLFKIELIVDKYD